MTPASASSVGVAASIMPRLLRPPALDELALTGSYAFGLDGKGRLVVPAAFRIVLGESFTLTAAPERCLMLLPQSDWRAVVSEWQDLPAVRGFYVANARRVTPRPLTGRVPIPYLLRGWADLQPHDECVLAGLGRVVRIVRRDRWDEEQAALEAGELDLWRAAQGGER